MESTVVNTPTYPTTVPSRTQLTLPLKSKLIKRERSEHEMLLNSPYSSQQDYPPSLTSRILQNTSDSSLNDEVKKLEEQKYYL